MNGTTGTEGRGAEEIRHDATGGPASAPDTCREVAEVRAGEPLRLMAVHAHPDDESSKGAAAMARYAAEGVEVLVVSCTGGERGDILNPHLADDPQVQADLPEIRRREMAEAARILGVGHHWLGFVDSGLPEGDPLPPLPAGCFALLDPLTAAAPLVELIRSFRPHVLTTYDELGGYPHPDHVQCHRVSMAAVDGAARPGAYPEAGEVWQVLKVYYNQGFSIDRLQAVHEAILHAGGESPFAEWIAERRTRPSRRDLVTTQVPCADYFAARDAALRAHATQVDPDGFFFAIPRDVEAAVWPTEDFELARSRVPISLPENDLFAGIRPEEA